MRKVIVIGLDGLEPRIVERMFAAGELPHMAGLRERGGYARLATTCPAQTPVAWATFSTGTNPGGHGIFDFIRRNPKTYLPDLALNRYEQKSAFLPPKAVNLRRGTAVWQLLSAAGAPSVVLRCPCTYPPDAVRGRMLCGMGVPDLRGGLGTSTLYTSAQNVPAKDDENVVGVAAGSGGEISTHLIGPRNPKTRGDFRCELSIRLGPGTNEASLRAAGASGSVTVRQGTWSDWLRVRFKTGLLQSIRGMVRFYLVSTDPVFELYASPVNFDPDGPPFPISSPPGYAGELADELGVFYTAGMVEDHGGLENGRFDERAYLAQCEGVWRERERMMVHELQRHTEGLFFCLFDTPDRVQHMFWRYGQDGAPAQGGEVPAWMGEVIADAYRRCDAIVGSALQHVDGQTLLILASDHGFTSFRRGVHLNTWLCDNGLLVLKGEAKPGEDAGELFSNVDWGRTKAYAMGLGGIYLNLRGREAQGIVASDEAEEVQGAIVKGLAGLCDPVHDALAVRSVVTRQQVYSGPYADESPDLVVNFAEGYRVSWSTALGGIPRGHFEDNVKKWSGDHIVDPALVPGVLLMNRPFAESAPNLVDLAPTILAALGAGRGPHMEGRSLLP
jgi:predicted AlkP superfamily phosphohydrolase/phosphomutase